jgi:hypothetical protein
MPPNFDECCARSHNPPNILTTTKGTNAMSTAIINGRKFAVPVAPTAEQIRAAAGIQQGRRLIRRMPDGNFPVKPGERIVIAEGDTFVDAPARVKGDNRIS